nr:MAG TPA: hypothetical protein [Inoviridae sp.]
MLRSILKKASIFSKICSMITPLQFSMPSAIKPGPSLWEKHPKPTPMGSRPA